MSELRWILIGFGIVLLAAIYLWGRRGNRAAASDDALTRARPEPTMQNSESTLLRSADELSATPLAEDDTPEIEPDPVEHSTSGAQDSWRGRLEPTFADAPTEEMPVRAAASSATTGAAPTLSSSEAPQARRVERRKILSVRLAMAPQRVEGAKLLEALLAESLQHGKYSIFHRLHTDGSIIFSIASMVEPGTFDLDKVGETLYPGITMFAQLPGPVPGMHALNEVIACARRLQANLGGTLQDERGIPLTVHRIERMRQEVREFERPPAGGGRGAGTQSAHL
ncbi:MAG TPA: cell division protein ZipA C-terminal FtsZ-binding domain-containing protein [Steroidobacteraceae bacterium]|nr:cell division protein ZipA C-terminal FtsZ-binding domain-containing protein [Steroidobacteraceae bacterium]